MREGGVGVVVGAAGTVESAAAKEEEEVVKEEKMLRVVEYASLRGEDAKKLTARPRKDFKKIFGIVEPIVERVRSDGDAAVFDLTRQFDLRPPESVDADTWEVCVPVSSLPWPELDPAIREAFDTAISNITAFHSAQRVAGTSGRHVVDMAEGYPLSCVTVRYAWPPKQRRHHG